MECVIVNKMLAFLHNHGAVTAQHHGFLSSKSNTSNLIETLNDWTLAVVESTCDNSHLQVYLDKLVNWSKMWQLQLSCSKCYLLHISKCNDYASVTVNSVPVASVKTVKDLGVHIDNKLKINSH